MGNLPDHIVIKVVDSIDSNMTRPCYERLLVENQLYSIADLQDNEEYAKLSKKALMMTSFREKDDQRLLEALENKGALNTKAKQALASIGIEMGMSLAGELASPAKEHRRLEVSLSRLDKAMKIDKLDMTNFKSFRKADLRFPQLTLLLGSNASGKSNVRDALRFLHGVSRGYSLPENLGGAYKEGVQVWRGIRGGSRELCHFGENRCTLEVGVDAYTYKITIEVLKRDAVPRVVAESLHGLDGMLFDSHRAGKAVRTNGKEHIHIGLAPGGKFRKAHIEDFSSSHPVLPRISERLSEKKRDDGIAKNIHTGARGVLTALKGLRFLDLSPDAMRIPAIPGETHLGDQGENLSSVLKSICADEKTAAALAAWVAELTPMDVAEFGFVSDAAGKILLQLVEADGRTVSANSASDGTLRFLGILAALLGEGSGNCFFMEEIDNGIHPARLDLMMKLLRSPPGPEYRHPSVISTTHSPSLLRLLGADGLDSAYLTYRPEGSTETKILCLEQVAGIREALKCGDLATLHESSWFEDVLAFTADAESEVNA